MSKLNPNFPFHLSLSFDDGQGPINLKWNWIFKMKLSEQNPWAFQTDRQTEGKSEKAYCPHKHSCRGIMINKNIDQNPICNVFNRISDAPMSQIRRIFLVRFLETELSATGIYIYFAILNDPCYLIWFLRNGAKLLQMNCFLRSLLQRI